VFCFNPFAGMVVLKMLGIRVEKYYASEVDKDAIMPADTITVA